MAKKYDDRPDGLAMLKQHIKAKEPQRLYIFHGEEIFNIHFFPDGFLRSPSSASGGRFGDACLYGRRSLSYPFATNEFHVI